MGAATKTVWRISGEEVASCNCAWGCPCQFNALPTTGRCEALVSWIVKSGHFGNLDLKGVKFAWIVSFPGAVHEGNGTRQVVVDEKASPEQRQAILEMSAGKVGGAAFEIFSAVCPNSLDPVFAPIALEVDREKRRASVRIPGVGETSIEPIKNPVTGEEHRARINLPNGFEYKEAEMGNTVHFKVTSHPKVKMEHKNSYAHLNAFDWTNI